MSQSPQLVIIDQPQNITEILSDLKTAELVAYDCETTGVYKGAEVVGISVCMSETKAYYVIMAAWNKQSQTLDYLPGMKEAARTVVSQLQHEMLVCHNGIFDCSMAQDYFGVSLIQALHTDTMIAAHLLDENRRVGLKELGVSMFGSNADEEARRMKESVLTNGGGVTKDNFEMYKADSRLLAEYGAKDALLTYNLAMVLIEQLYNEGLDKFFYEDESMPLLKGPTYEMNTTGLKVDLNELLKLKKTLEVECEEDKAFIYQEIQPHIKDKYPGTKKANTFNIGASQQLSWLMFGVMGLEFGTLTKAGKEACKDLNLKLPYAPGAKREFIAVCERAVGSMQRPDCIINGKKVRAKKFKAPWAYICADKTSLQKHAPKHKWIERLLSYQKKMKMLSTYITGLEERIQYGIIRPSFLQHGTTSGRYSSRNPNFQNLPRDDKRIKACIVSRPGKSFVGADYSQLEPRVFAYFSNDKALLRAFDGSSDFYSVIGMKVFGKSDCTPQKDGSPEAFGVKYKKLRGDAKTIALASVYGATAFQISKTTGKNEEDSQQDIDNYFEEFPGVAALMLDSHAQIKKQGYVENLFGRKRRVPDAMKIDKIYGKKTHAEYPYEVRSILNLATNHKIQSTGASICNRAMIKFYNDIRDIGITDCHLVLQVHDEIVVECKDADAETVSLVLQNAMETAVMLETITLEAVPNTGKNLAALK